MYRDLQNQHYLCKNFVILTASYSNLRNFLDNIKKTHLQCWYIITTSGIFNWNGKHETSAVVNITLYILLAHSLCCKTTDCRTFFPLGKLLYKYKLSLCHLNSFHSLFFPTARCLCSCSISWHPLIWWQIWPELDRSQVFIFLSINTCSTTTIGYMDFCPAYRPNTYISDMGGC